MIEVESPTTPPFDKIRMVRFDELRTTLGMGEPGAGTTSTV